MGRHMIKRIVFVLLGGFAVMIQPACAQTFNGSVLNSSSGNTDTASAVFSLVNGSTTYLQVMLTNTSTFSKYSNPDLLSGLFFAIATGPTLTPDSAVTTTLVNPTACAASQVTTCEAASVNVGNQWGYVYSQNGFTSSALTTAAQYGVAAPGYSSLTPSFGSSQIFSTNPPALAAKGTPQLAFSIVGSNYNASTSGISSKDPLLQNSLTFEFGLPIGVTSLKISNVSFAYGTAPDGSAAGTSAPEPASLAIVSTGLAILAIVRRRKGRPALA
jgi:hypothetical protein